jgi:acetate---CoA ligase (ADP-forming)
MSWTRALFRPSRVAVVGSCSPGKLGHVLITQLLDGGFANVVAVNPKGQAIREIPAAQSMAELSASGSEIDLAIIASPATTVASVLEDAGRAGVKAAVIITAGFSESGSTRDEQQLLSIARRYGIRIVGPNCAGIVNTKHALFPTLETRPPVGDVAFISQSGALGGAVLSWAEEQGVGLSKFVSYGNAADISEIDLLDYLRDDDETSVVALYIETVSDGRRFMEAASNLAAVKPLIVIKSGRSESGGRATQSHTGSMAGSDAIYQAALQQCGAIRVDGIEEMFDLCRGFVHLPPVLGNRIAIVTNSGGPGVLTADAGDSEGLEISPPSVELRDRLAAKLPDFYALTNPFDLTVQGTQEEYRDTLIETLTEYDAAIAINVNTPYLDVAPLARGVVAAAQKTGKPIIASFVAGQPAEAALPILAAGGVPNYVTGERCARVLARMAEREQSVKRLGLPVGSDDTGAGVKQEPLTTQSLPWIQRPTEPEAMDWLESVGIPVIAHKLAKTIDEALLIASGFNQAVAMKIASPHIVHKTDVGGVALGLKTNTDIEKAFSRMKSLVAANAFDGVLITPMVDRPVEAIVGLSTDQQFGPAIAVGIGGIYTEIFKDIVLRVAPVSVDEAQQMIESLRGINILKGARGSALRDISSLAKLVSDVSHLPFRFEGIEELDLNPVFLLERGCEAGDARLIPSDSNRHQRSE